MCSDACVTNALENDKYLFAWVDCHLLNSLASAVKRDTTEMSTEQI